jgi:hypothetical protein
LLQFSSGGSKKPKKHVVEEVSVFEPAEKEAIMLEISASSGQRKVLLEICFSAPSE